MDCNCPAPTALTTIEEQTCGVDMKQIQRIAFQRKQDTAPFTAVNILTLAAWQALTTAVDTTKIVITPLIGGDPIIEPGEAITSGGGDNSTLNGVEEVEGVNPSNFSCLFKSLSAAIEKQIKALMCEKGLTVYFFLQGGRIACVEIPGSPANEFGFDIQSFFFSDRSNAGFGTKDTHNMRFSLVDGWSENLVILKPSFNPLTEL